MKVVIIGNGAAGNQAAETIRDLDQAAEILMISQEEFPAYSACALPDYLAGWIPRSGLFLKSAEDYADLGIKTLFGSRVGKIVPEDRALLLGNELIPYDKLILASGSRAIVPPLKGADLDGNFVVKSVSDLDKIVSHPSRRVVVVGSGNIGVEMAEAMQLQGKKVYLIELMESLMPRFLDGKPAGMLRDLLEENGITVHCGEKVLEVSGQTKVEGIITDKREIGCDTIIWAIGVRQNVELAREAGVEIGGLGGIKVNKRMECNLPDIFAAGDCIESFDMMSGEPRLSLLWPSAKRQGEIAAMNICGIGTEYEGAFDVVVEEIYDKTFVSVGSIAAGLKDHDFKVEERDLKPGYYRFLLRDDCLAGIQLVGDCSGMGSLLTLLKKRVSLGGLQGMLDDEWLVQRMPWYRQAGNILLE